MTPPPDPQDPAPKGGLGRFRRVIAAFGAALGLCAVFLGATVAGIAIHVDLPPARRLIQETVNDGLSSVFHGRIVADEIDHVSLARVDIHSAVVLDPRGAQVIQASGIHAQIDVLTLVRRALLGTGDLVVTIPFVRVDTAAVLVEPGPTGLPTIAETFVLTAPPAPPPPGARALRVDLDRIEVGHAWAHGAIAPPRSLDADVTRLAGSLHVAPEGVTLDVEQTGLADRGLLPARTAGSADYHLRLKPTAPLLQMWTAFSGQVGGVQVQARALMEDDHLVATAEIPRATPEEIATVLPDLPLHEPVAARLDLDGALPTLSLHGRVGVEAAKGGGGEVLLEGALDASSPVGIALDFDARALDVGVLYPIAASPLDATGRVRLQIGEPLRLEVEARTGAVVVENNLIPPAEVHLVLDRGELVGRATLHEVGMPIEAAVALNPTSGLRFDASADIPSIRAAPRIAGAVDGSAHVRVTGTVKADVLDARVTGGFADLRAPGDTRLGGGGIDGRVRGTASSPGTLELDAVLRGQKVQTGGYVFDRVIARAHGPALHPHLTATLLANPPREGQPEDDPTADGLRASGDLDPRSGSVRGLKVQLRREGTEVSGTVARVGGGGGGVAIEGVALEGNGVGKVSGGLVVRGGELVGRLHGEGVDLARVRQLAGIAQRMKGIADFDVELAPSRKGRKGRVAIALEDGEISLLTGVSANVTATFDDDGVKADGLVRLIAHAGDKDRLEDRCSGSIAEVRLTGAEGELAGPLLDPRSWERLAGRAEIAAEDWDLRCLAQRTPGVRLLLSEVRGRLAARATVVRRANDRFPSVHDLVARTRGLELAGQQALDADKPAWESRALDVQVSGDLDASTGKTTAKVALFDGALLAEASLDAALDLRALVDRPKDRWATARRTVFSAHAGIPRRNLASLASLPTLVRDALPPLAGEIRVDAYADGTLDHPFAVLKANAWSIAAGTSLGSAEPTSLSVPLSAEAIATYDAEKAALDVRVSHENKEIAAGNGEITLALGEVLAGRAPAWTGGFFAKLTEVPLGELPFLADRDIGGHLDGTIAIAGLHERPSIAVSLTAPDLQLGQDYYLDHGSLALDVIAPTGADGDRSTARARLELVGQDGGRLDASGFTGVRWVERAVPTIDAGAAADLYAKAKGFRLAAFHPLVADLLSKLDGYLDGDIRVGWSHASEGSHGTLAAKMAVTKGIFHVPQIGQEFHDAAVSVVSRADGTLGFEGIRAEGTRGRITGSGSATLDGLLFKSAEAKLAIARGEEIPLTLEGVPVGDARGEISIQAEKEGREIRASLRTPSFHLELPAQSGRAVAPLEEDPDISVSHPTGQVREPRSPDALRWALTVDLGRLDVSGNNLDVAVAGSRASPPRVELGEKVTVSGDLDLLAGGRIEVLGKRFVIDYGIVRLRPDDASNPFLNVRAHWEGAPAGATIFVEYVGVLRPITPEKLKFSSDSGLSQDAIQAMLLGTGDATASADAGGRGLTQLAGGLAAEIASQQLNSVLSGSVLKGLTAQFGVNDDGTLRPGVAYALGDKLRVGAIVESSGPGSTPGSAPFGCVSATKTANCTQIDVDWRFRPNWLIRGSVTIGGDQPSSGIDLLWQYRY